MISNTLWCAGPIYTQSQVMEKRYKPYLLSTVYMTDAHSSNNELANQDLGNKHSGMNELYDIISKYRREMRPYAVGVFIFTAICVGSITYSNRQFVREIKQLTYPKTDGTELTAAFEKYTKTIDKSNEAVSKDLEELSRSVDEFTAAINRIEKSYNDK